MRYYFKVLKRYASVEGRASRAEFWNFFLFNYLISVTLAFIEFHLRTNYLVLFYNLAIFLPALAVGMRRMHDAGKYGWYMLIPGYNLVLACFPSTSGPNAYGPAPNTRARQRGA